jgi:glycosyltransferase involved in cell wall biosynthesis
MAALDILSLSSAFGEGFPNAIGEAMACEVPCVVTDVGDSAEIVGDAGLVVPPRNPTAMAEAWETLLAKSPEERRVLGRAARERIARNFSLDVVTRQYEILYAGLKGDPPVSSPSASAS